MATIYDIAKKCGISPATVSKALSNATDVSAATRDRVRRVAAEMNYVPDARAKSLSRNRSWSIGVLCQDGSEMGLRHYLFAAIIESFKTNVEKLGYDICILSNQVGNIGLSYLGHCRYRKLDGVFIVNADHDSSDLVELVNSDLPKIAFDYPYEHASCITTDTVEGMKLLYDYLWQLGHRDIVYFHGDRKRHITNQRIDALKAAAAAHGVTIDESALVRSSYYSITAGRDSMRALFREGRKPSAVICSDDYSAVGAINAIRAAGMSVPEDISICGYDGIEITQLCYPQLTTIRQNTDVIGQLAAENLIAQINTPVRSRTVTKLAVKPELIIGKSCAPVR